MAATDIRSEHWSLVAGPLPPPVGGIATIVAKLRDGPFVGWDVDFLDTSKKGGKGWSRRLIEPATKLAELNRRLRGRPRNVLIFCSAHGSFWEKGLWLMLSRWRGVPMMVMMVDGTFPAFYSGLPRLLQGLVRWLLERFSTVIVQTESWRRFYAGIAPRGRYLVLPNGVDCEEFRPTERISRGSSVILFVGWLIREKGIFDLLEAVRILKEKHRDFLVKLVGPFHGNESAIRARVSEGGLAGFVQPIGVLLSREEILDAYRCADVFVLPSWAEGLPVAVLEAMACGLPVVASSVGGIPDLVEDGVTGLLVPPRDPQALAVALERLIVDGDVRVTLGNAARAKVKTSFSNDAFVRGVRALLSARPSAAS